MGVGTNRAYLFIAFLLLTFGLQCRGQRNAAQKNKSKLPQQPASCSKNEFACGNKKCVPLSALCNGTSECADGKDEAADQCTVIKTGVCTEGGEAKNFCDDSFDDSPEQNSTHQFLCQSETIRKNGSVSVACYNGVWTPTTTHCTRICQPIVIPTTNMTCLRNGKEVNCSQPLLIGTKITNVQCEPFYRPSEPEVVCQGNGSWSRNTVDCIPECGRQLKDKIRNATSVRSAEYREFPWSVAIYYTKPGATTPIPIQGTIISPYLVVTTAINFDPEYRQELLNPDSTVVIVAKRTKDPEVTDDQFQKTYQVRDIYFTEKGYQESDNSSSSENIAIIELKEKIVLSPSVYPACVNWGKNETLYPNEETVGQVPHIVSSSLDGNASEHQVLQTVALHYVNRIECLSSDTMKKAPQTVRTDNFCSEPIATSAPGDGAFIFQEPTTNLFYIQGLVDGVTPSAGPPQTITNTFLDLSAHMDWIKAVRQHTEGRFIDKIWLQVESADQADICKKNFTSKDNSSVGLRSGFGDEEPANLTNGCKLPNKNETNASNYTISCDSSVTEHECQKIRESGSTVPEFTMLRIDCENGYGIDSNKEVVCFKNKWTPAITPCKGTNKANSGVGPRQGSVTPSSQKPAIRRPGSSSPRPGSNQNQSTQSPASQNISGVDPRLGGRQPAAGKPANGSKRPGYKPPQQPNTQDSDAVGEQNSTSPLPDQIDFGEIPDQDVSPSSPQPVYIRPGGGSRTQPNYNQPTEPDLQVVGGYNPSTQHSVRKKPGYQPSENPNQVGYDNQDVSPSSQRPIYRRPGSSSQTQPSYNQPSSVDYENNQLQGYSTSQSSPVDDGDTQGLGYRPSSERPINERPGTGSRSQAGYGFNQPSQQTPNQDYGDIQYQGYPESQRPQVHYGETDGQNQGYTPSSRPPVNRRPGTSSPAQPSYNPYDQQPTADDTLAGQVYNPASQPPVNRKPGTSSQTRPGYNPYGQQTPVDDTVAGQGTNNASFQPPVNRTPGSSYRPQPGYNQPTQTNGILDLRGGFDSQQPPYVDYGYVPSQDYYPSSQLPPYQGSYGGVQGQTFNPASQQPDSKIPGSSSQLPPGYQPQLPSQSNNGVSQPRGYGQPPQQRPYQNSAGNIQGQVGSSSSQRPVYWPPGSRSQTQPGYYTQSTTQQASNGFGARQDFNVPSEESPIQGGYSDYTSNQNYNPSSPSPPYENGDNTNIDNSYSEQPNQSSLRPQLPQGSPSCTSEGFFPIWNDCTHFYRCVRSGTGFSKFVFSCGPGTVWDSDMNTCNHAWAVQRPDCRQGA
jgi:hypothetical protein